MQILEVKMTSLNEDFFLVSFVNPLTERKVRKRFTSKKEANKYKERIEEKHSLNSKKSFQNFTIEELALLFIKENKKPSFAYNKVHVIDFIETFLDMKIDELTTPILKSWLDQVQKENGLKSISMRNIKCELDTFFNFLERREIISKSPLKEVFYKKSPPPIRARNILSEREISELLGAIKSFSPGYLYPIIKLISETGAKTQEVISLEWGDIDLEKGLVKFAAGKKIQARRLPISDELLKYFAERKKEKEFVFMTYYKEPFTSKKIQLAVNEFKREKAYSSQWCLMDLRHSFAVNFLSKGGDIRKLQQILGHNNVYDTKRLYGEAVTEKVREEVLSPF